MARPVYIICAESVAADQQTNLVSAFQLIERISLRETPTTHPEVRPLAHFRCKVVAVWMKEPGDEDKEFEHEIVFPITRDGKEASHKTDTFSFPSETLFQRFLVTVVGIPYAGETGVIEIVSRLRAVGDNEWKTQSYPLLVEVEELREITDQDDERAHVKE